MSEVDMFHLAFLHVSVYNVRRECERDHVVPWTLCAAF